MNTSNNPTITTYPLSWPISWPRTPRYLIQNSLYTRKSMVRVIEELKNQVRLLGGSDLIISSNISLRQDGLPRAGQKQPEDRGVAIYFVRKGQPFCFANDKWATVEENLWAISLTVEALRQIERTGCSDMLERAFTGFLALPAPKPIAWWEVLGVSQNSGTEKIKVAYRNLAKKYHPDLGGSIEEFRRIQEAYEIGIGFNVEQEPISR